MSTTVVPEPLILAQRIIDKITEGMTPEEKIPHLEEAASLLEPAIAEYMTTEQRVNFLEERVKTVVSSLWDVLGAKEATQDV